MHFELKSISVQSIPEALHSIGYLKKSQMSFRTLNTSRQRAGQH
jgi:hypothetical protein